MATVNEGVKPAETTKKTKEEAVKMVDLYVPREHAKQKDLYIAVNGERFLLKRGTTVKVPEYVAEVYYNSLNAKEEAMRYTEELLERNNKM